MLGARALPGQAVVQRSTAHLRTPGAFGLLAFMYCDIGLPSATAYNATPMELPCCDVTAVS